MTSWIKRNYPAIPILIAVLGTALLDQSFAKFRIGPVFPLELCWLAWALLAALAGWHRSLPLAQLKKSPFTGMGAFFVWGLLLLFYDLIVRRGEIGSEFGGVLRVFQHALLFVYPLLWMTAGLVTYRRSAQSVRIIAFCALAACIGIALVRGPHDLNIGMGSIAAVVLMVIVARSWAGSKRRHKSNSRWWLSCVVGLIVLAPFARDVAQGVVQRVLMTELVVLIVAMPFFYNGKGRAARSLAQVALVLAFFAALIVVEVAVFTDRGGLSLADSISLQAAKSLRHGDDVPGGKIEDHPANDMFLKAGYRRFWWSQAVQDWRVNPVFGRGFIPEIPSYVRAGSPNNGHFDAIPDFKNHNVDRPLVGPHNSYLSVLARTGLIGALIFIAFLGQIGVVSLRVLRSSQGKLFGFLAVAFVFDGLSTAVLQVGLEAPYNCIALWFFVGVLTAINTRTPQNAASTR